MSRAHETCVWLIIIGFNLQGASSSSCGNWINAMDEMKSLIVDLKRELSWLTETVQGISDRQQRLKSEWEQASGAAQGMATGQVDTSPADQQTTIEDVTSTARIQEQVTTSSLGTGSIPSRQKCKNGFYNGTRCASTTRYIFGNHGPGSCNCGADSRSVYPWVKSKYTAAVNEALFNQNSKFGTWCGATCGRCYKLTTTGGYVPGQGRAHSAGQSITVMVTNACGRDADATWCGQDLNGTNSYGYLAHFNIVNDSGQIDRFGWDNPEVTYVEVACGSGGAPTSDEFNTCRQCI